MEKIDYNKVPAFYYKYINLVKSDDLNAAFHQHMNELADFLQTIEVGRWNYRYAEGKWSIKDLVQHMIDTERIMCYRALCISRKDENSLPGFDENKYASNAKGEKRTKSDLIEELQMVQQSSAKLFASFDEEQLESSGIANGNPVYVKGLGFIIVGHALHHKNVLQEKYL